MSDWQDIATAPRDGTQILALCQPRFVETGKPMSFDYINVVWWRGEKFKDSFTQWRHALNDSAAEPTHWMPLPSPPLPVKEGGEMARTGRQRLDAIPAAVERRDEFLGRVTAAEGDAVRCADLMAEAITTQIEASHLETVKKSGRVTVCIEEVMAGHCMIAARDAYLRARGSNAAPDTATGSD